MLKNPSTSASLNPRTLDLEASTLPRDQRLAYEIYESLCVKFDGWNNNVCGVAGGAGQVRPPGRIYSDVLGYRQSELPEGRSGTGAPAGLGTDALPTSHTRGQQGGPGAQPRGLIPRYTLIYPPIMSFLLHIL